MHEGGARKQKKQLRGSFLSILTREERTLPDQNIRRRRKRRLLFGGGGGDVTNAEVSSLLHYRPSLAKPSPQDRGDEEES